jgi:hypothetical protein
MKKGWTHEKVLARIKSGHGSGSHADYKPWIGVRDLSSKGVSTRMWSPKTGRMMAFLSNIERDIFLVSEFREDFVDYQEQWPLDVALTEQAAEVLGYRHPTYIGFKRSAVMTVDGVLTLRREGGNSRRAIDCKHSTDLTNPRTLEKLAIVRGACERLRLPHVLITEKGTCPTVVKNVLWVRIATEKSGELKPVPGAFDMWPMRMHRHLLTRASQDSFSQLLLNDYCSEFEREFQLPPGMGLRSMKLLMWQHLVDFDLSVTAPEELPLGSLTIREPATTWRAPAPTVLTKPDEVPIRRHSGTEEAP